MIAAEEMEPAGYVHVNAGRLWAGGVATAFVAALAVLAGVLITRGVLGIPVLAPKAASDFGDSSTAVYAGLAAGVALLATALLHVLLLGTPRPLWYSPGSPGRPTCREPSATVHPAGPVGEQDLHRDHQHSGGRGRDLPALGRRPRRHPYRRPAPIPTAPFTSRWPRGCAQ